MDKILELLKEKKPNIYFVIILLLIVVTISKNIDNIKLFIPIIIEIISVVRSHIVAVLFGIFTYGFLKTAFNISNKKCEERLDKHYNDITLETQNAVGLKVKVFEEPDKRKGYATKIRCYCTNNGEHKIDYVKGFIQFYRTGLNDKICVFKIPFESFNFKENTSEELFNDYKHLNWNNFIVNVVELKIGANTYSNIEMCSSTITKTYSVALNYDHYYDYRFLGIRTRYNLVWFKEQIDLFNRLLSFFYSKKRLGTESQLVYYCGKVLRVIKRIIVACIYISLFALLGYTIYELSKMVIEIINVIRLTSVIA